MAKTKKINSILICVLLVGSMIILNSTEVAAQSIGGTVYEDTNMNGVFDGTETPLPGADIFLDYPAGTTTTSGGGGVYNIGTTHGFHWVTARLPGYKTVTRNVNVTGAMAINFGLIPFESITGRAVKTDGTGVVGMHVEVWQGGRHLTQYDTFTDAFGNYCIHGVPPGTYDLHIQKAEYYDQWKYNITVDSVLIGGTQYNHHTTTNINFTNLSYDHGMIYGTVSSGANPLPGAVVEVPGLGLSTTTDNSGNYMIHNIPAGWYYVVVRKTGYQTGVEHVCVSNGTAGATGPILFNVASLVGAAHPPVIEGKVSDGVQAIENALVEIPGLGYSYGTGDELYTDKGGYYIFTDYTTSSYNPHVFGPGKYAIVVRNEAGNVTDESDNHHKTNARTVVAQSGRVTVADFRLEENPGIKLGRVINTDGIGVEGAKVYIPYSPYSTMTDSNGVFALELPSETYSENCDTAILPYQTLQGNDEMNYCGMVDTFQTSCPGIPSCHRMHKARYLIKVEKANYEYTLEYYIPVPGGPGLASLDPQDPCDLCENGIVLKYKTGILKGQVYNAGGQPVTNGYVFVAGRDVPLQANGFFEVHEVPVGTYTAAVIDPTRTILGVETGIHIYYDSITYQVINLGATPTTHFISGFIYSNKVRPHTTSPGDIEADPNGYTAGAAFDPGEGISRVTVETTYSSTYNAQTDSYGFYCITGIPTSVTSTTIVAIKTGYITIANPAVTPSSVLIFTSGFAGTAGATVSPMSKFRGSLRGRVTNEQGRDVSSAIVSIWEPAEVHDETDTNGFYIFENVEYGSYLVKVCGGGTCGIDYKVAFSTGSSYAPVTVNGNVTADITMEKMKGRVEGIVDDGVNRLQDVAVRISGKYHTSTDTMGYYTVLDVPSGTHTAYAYAYGYMLQKHNSTDQSIGIVGGQLFTANFTLTPGLMNTGWIEGFISLELTDGYCNTIARLNPSFDSATTDSEGYYLLTGLSSGSNYYVHGEKANYTMVGNPVGPLAVGPGVGAWAQQIHLKRCTGTIDGYLTDSQTGAPISGATVILSDMNRNNDVSTWSPGSDYYTDYGRSQIYQTTTDATGYYQFTNVPWSDGNTSGVNKTWAWSVVMLKTGYAVGVSNAAVVCGSTSTVSFAVDPLCAISGTVSFDISCASSATVTATQIAGGDEGSTEFGWSDNGVATVMTSGNSYYIGHLHPGAYNVTATAGSCTMINPTSPYTGANAIPANYRYTTPNVDFNFGTTLTSGSGSGDQGTGSGNESADRDSGGSGDQGTGSEGDSGSGSGDQGTAEQDDESSKSSSTPGESTSQTSQRSSTASKLLMEVAMDTIKQAKILHNKAYNILGENISEEIQDLLTQADTYLEKAQNHYNTQNYAEALEFAKKAIQYYQEILESIT